ncbi:MAG: hypothetical protein MK116_03415 [Phycisphaerales bacterium]|nr:hypothetical protein [Phycisphaerales bacterium]MCH2153681.1 hypothetical protein [Phycisphaerales bacterium]
MTQENSRNQQYHIAVVSRTTGCANALAPTMALLQDLGHQVNILAFPPSWKSLDDAGLHYEKIHSAHDGIEILERLEHLDLLLSGTSEEADEDGILWRWAEAHGISTMAFLDSWANYSMRFTTPGSNRPLDLLPDCVAVPDSAARTRMTEAGCPADRIVVTGNPAFDAWPNLGQEIGKTWRESILQPGETIVITFVMEVLREYYGDDPDSPTYLGYTEDDALATAMKAVSDLSEQLCQPILFAIAPYPGEDSRKLETMVNSIVSNAELQHDSFRAVVLHDHDRYAIVSGSDIVTGMISTLLYEASLTDVPVISIQPRRRFPNDLTDLHPEIVVTTEQEAMFQAMKAALESTRESERHDSSNSSSLDATRTLASSIISRIGRDQNS